MTEVIAVQMRTQAIYAGDWDAFAQQCGASMRSAYRQNRAWSVKHLLRARLRVFEIVLLDDGFETKIGQCAIGKGSENVILDRLQLLPEFSKYWMSAMEAILKVNGPGVYRYGWELNLEECRAKNLRGIGGVTVKEVRPIVAHVVEFQRWLTWEAYWKELSNNVRRNVKKASTSFPDLSIKERDGLAALRGVAMLLYLRRMTFRRKGLGLQVLAAATSSVANILSCPKYSFISIASGGGRSLAGFNGSRFGSNTYYTDGGSRSENSGASWFLLTSMLRKAYEQDPSGRFIMGYVDNSIHDDNVGGGLLRSRESCRVSEISTSIVVFQSRMVGSRDETASGTYSV